MIGFEWKYLWRARALTNALLLVLVAAVCAIGYGRAAIDQQRRVIADLPGLLESGERAYLQSRMLPQDNVGFAAYYLSTSVAHDPTPWAPLAIGVRDLHPYFLNVRLLGLQSQLYDSGMENPQKSLAGNFDVAFVLIYLFPLLIVGLTYDALSGEREAGTLRLVRSLASPLWRIVAARLLVRCGVVLGLAVGVVGVGMLYDHVPLGAAAASWLLTTFAYLLFWTAIAFLVTALRLSTSLNATLLLAAWLLLVVIVPATANIAVEATHPVEAGYALTLRERQVMNDSWDQPRHETYKRFKQEHQEWASQLQEVTDKFTWAWYYAAHQVADDSVKAEAAAYRASLMARDRMAASTARFCPPLLVQRAFERLARSDLETQLDYLDQVAAAHQNLQRQLYPMIFRDTELPRDQLVALSATMPRLHYAPPPLASVAAGVPGLLVASLGMLGFSISLLRFRSQEEV